MIQVLRIPDFRLLWLARTATAFGAGLLVIAVPAHVHSLTGSVTATGLTLAVENLPILLLGPLAGSLADRWDRRRLMIGADLLHAAAIASLPLASGAQRLWIVYAAVLVQGAAATAFRPAAQAHLPSVVGEGAMLPRANALSAFTAGVVGLVSAPVGGLLAARGNLEAVVAVSVAASLLSAAAIARTRTPSARPLDRPLDRPPRPSRFHLPRPARVLLASHTLYLFANAALTALLVPFALARLGGTTELGYLLSALGLGFLVGAPISARLVERFPARPLIATAQALVALAFLAMVNGPAIAAAFLVGVPGALVPVALYTWLQRTTAAGLLGRVSSAFLTADAAAAVLGAIAGPALAGAAGLPVALNAACAVAMLAALITCSREREPVQPGPAGQPPGLTGAQAGEGAGPACPRHDGHDPTSGCGHDQRVHG
ncbi:MFS family permease [Nonomuraea soli]|uniref:MFS family permease n=1 Tax=Nonomuraea soli TaxID=1032476 RepID=A0A7W0CFZ6_9ACTN|nr:MFS family permease [Nonomuraea soli]